jgi:hypothetical protein
MPLSPEEINQLQHAAAQHQEQQRQAFHQHLANEERKLLEKVPEWAQDLEKAKKDISEIKNFMVEEHGYAPQDLAVIVDHRAMLGMKSYYEAHNREKESKRRALEERSKRERAQKAEADKAAEQQKLLGETKKKLRKNYGSTHAQAEALADAFGVNE